MTAKGIWTIIIEVAVAFQQRKLDFMGSTIYLKILTELVR